MRVIAGKYKGRVLFCPKTDVRPTLDRTKETLFNIINFDVPDAKILDLFAGTGQLGIEALSRGAKHVVFCDLHSNCVETINANCQKIKCENDCEVIKSDFDFYLNTTNRKFDIVFIDPPYNSDYYQKALETIANRNLLEDDGLIICEHLREKDLPEKIANFVSYDNRKIGTVQFTFYQKEDVE